MGRMVSYRYRRTARRVSVLDASWKVILEECGGGRSLVGAAEVALGLGV